MRFLFIILFSFSSCLNLLEAARSKSSDIVVETKRIYLEEFPEVFNPSLIKTDYGFLMTFRHCLHPVRSWVSYIGVVMLDHDLNVISRPQLLNTRRMGSKTPSQAEDARIFSLNGKMYLVYNDNRKIISPSNKERRDMYIAEIEQIDDDFVLGQPLKIFHEQRHSTTKWQKNWVPFEWNNQLLMAYSINPHEVLSVNTVNGFSKILSTTEFKNRWSLGTLRGGTPAILVDGRYLAFFHSSKKGKTPSNKYMHHYYMGAYTFAAEPPFKIKKISKAPIMADTFYTESSYGKRVIFPGGFAVVQNQIYLAYGKDDSEIWVAIINKDNLMRSLKNPTRKR